MQFGVCSGIHLFSHRFSDIVFSALSRFLKIRGQNGAQNRRGFYAGNVSNSTLSPKSSHDAPRRAQGFPNDAKILPKGPKMVLQGVLKLKLQHWNDVCLHLAKSAFGRYVVNIFICILHLKHVPLQCNNCFIGFQVPVVSCFVATPHKPETSRLITVACWHGGVSSRSELDIIHEWRGTESHISTRVRHACARSA